MAPVSADREALGGHLQVSARLVGDRHIVDMDLGAPDNGLA